MCLCHCQNYILCECRWVWASESNALKAFIKTSMGLGDGPLPPDEAHQYQLALRSVLDSLAVSLAREVAQALLSGGPGGTRAPARARVREYEGRGGAQ